MGWQGVTGGYKWWPGVTTVTGGFKWLQGVTKGYKGLQGVTRGDKGLQRVTKDYKNFFLTRTFPDTFSWSIFQKNQIVEMSNFWRKRRTNPFGKMPILSVFKPTFSLFRKGCLLYKTSKIVFSRFIFRFYDMGIQGLQGVTRGYKGWQGVTRGYRGLQGVTGG